METPKTAKNLKLALVGLDPPIAISNFDNYSGTLISPIAELGLREGAILTNDGKALWGGIVRINADSTFDLCVSPAANAAKDEVIPWKDLPPFFTVFDGGYESLSQESVNTLLDDLITFNDLVKVRCHFELNGKQESVTGKWGDQENLKTLSEIFIDWNFSQKLVPEQLVLLEIELFETVYFVIAIHEECDHEGIVLSLTSHFYQQRNRIGRRIPIDPIEIDGLKILEVSDFGMKVSSQATSVVGTEELRVTINGFQLSFGITYKKKVSPEETQMGLFIQDHSPEARKAWQGFLLGHQFPLLKIRGQEDYESMWNLFEKSGYLSLEFGKSVKLAATEVELEWRLVDSAGPTKGTTVIGYDAKAPVATIGVSRAIGNLWVAQAAAVLDKPEYIKYTRSMYSWRTRYLLQQHDAAYHLAVFVKSKSFLNRFFRKFYLTRDEVSRNEIVWEEWFFYSMCLKQENNIKVIDEATIDNASTGKVNSSRFLGLIEKSIEGAETSYLKTPNGSAIRFRPYLHIAQYFNSIFLSPTTDLKVQTDFLINQHLKNFVAMSESKISNDQMAILNNLGFGCIGGHQEVTWACPRVQLPNFLQNSLKSLELMAKKYGSRDAA